MSHLDDATLAQTWSDYKELGSLELRNELIVHYSSLVRYVAAKVGDSLPPNVDRDDLISYGMFGLMDAIEKFCLDKDVKFETYGVVRIRGAIYDEIRSQDWVPRSVRSKAKELKDAREKLQENHDRPVRHEEVAQFLGLSMEDYWQLVSQANVTYVNSLNDTTNDEDGGVEMETAFDPMMNPEDLFQAGEITDLVSEAISGMDERSKMILVLYYLQEMTLAEIGKILGVTESRVCQLQSKALMTLRDGLGHGGAAAA